MKAPLPNFSLVVVGDTPTGKTRTSCHALALEKDGDKLKLTIADAANSATNTSQER